VPALRPPAPPAACSTTSASFLVSSPSRRPRRPAEATMVQRRLVTCPRRTVQKARRTCQTLRSTSSCRRIQAGSALDDSGPGSGSPGSSGSADVSDAAVERTLQEVGVDPESAEAAAAEGGLLEKGRRAAPRNSTPGDSLSCESCERELFPTSKGVGQEAEVSTRRTGPGHLRTGGRTAGLQPEVPRRGKHGHLL